MSIKTKGVGDVIKGLYRRSTAVQQEIKQEIADTAANAEARVIALAPEDTGAYKGAIDTRKWNEGFSAAVGPNPEKLKAAGHSPNLAIWLEYGTSKTRRRPHVTIVSQLIRNGFIRRINKKVRQALNLNLKVKR